jgi:hypothetical protein
MKTLRPLLDVITDFSSRKAGLCSPACFSGRRCPTGVFHVTHHRLHRVEWEALAVHQRTQSAPSYASVYFAITFILEHVVYTSVPMFDANFFTQQFHFYRFVAL